VAHIAAHNPSDKVRASSSETRLLRRSGSRSVDLSEGEADLGATLASIGYPIPVIGSARPGHPTLPAPPGFILPVPRQAPVRGSVKILSWENVGIGERQEKFVRTPPVLGRWAVVARNKKKANNP
jgi:hypothetical protein